MARSFSSFKSHIDVYEVSRIDLGKWSPRILLLFYFPHFQIVYIQVVNILYHLRNVRGALENLSPKEAKTSNQIFAK